MKIAWCLCVAMFLSGCVMLDERQIAAALQALRDSDNAVCVEIVGSGGGGTAVLPGVPFVPGGAYGYGRITIGRADRDHFLRCSADGVEITPKAGDSQTLYVVPVPQEKREGFQDIESVR